MLPSIVAACASESATLLPSPTKAMVRPRSDPHLSRMRQAVGQRLTRVFFVGERVDDPQPRRGGGERFEARLRVGADHRAVHPALEVARHVLDRLAAAERDVLGRLDDVAAELADRDLERRAGPERRLLEQQRDVPALERPDVG